MIPLSAILCFAWIAHGSCFETKDVDLGNATELLLPGKIENQYFSADLSKTCFGAQYGGSTGHSITEDVLTFNEPHPEIQSSFVFLDSVSVKCYEIIENLSTTEFRIAEINPLDVFHRLKLRTARINDPDVFEGFASLEVSGLNFGIFDFEARTFNEVLVKYDSKVHQMENSNELFSLYVSVLGFPFKIAISSKTATLVEPKTLNVSGKFTYGREFHNEPVVGASMNTYDLNASEYITSESYPKKPYITYDGEFDGGDAEIDMHMIEFIDFKVSIGASGTTITTMTDYIVSNKITFEVTEDIYVEYDVAMNHSRQWEPFNVYGVDLWQESALPSRIVEVPAFDIGKEKLFNETLHNPRAKEIPMINESTVLFPYEMSCDAEKNLTIRVDAFDSEEDDEDDVVDSLLLEPVTFNHNTIKQRRTRLLKSEASSYIFKVFVRDRDTGDAHYIPAVFRIADGNVTLFDNATSLTMKISFVKAREVGVNKFYSVTEDNTFVYFEPGRHRYGIIRREKGKFIASPEDAVFYHEASISSRDETCFWNYLTIELTFQHINIQRATSLKLKLCLENSKPFYEAVFTRGSSVPDINDRIRFQMSESWNLHIYLTVVVNQYETISMHIKHSQGQLEELIGNGLKYEIGSCEIKFNINRYVLTPVFTVSRNTDFCIAETFFDYHNIDSDTNNSYGILRHEITSIKSVEEWPNLNAVLFNCQFSPLLPHYFTDGASIIMNLKPGENIRNGVDCVILNIPIFCKVSGMYPCDDLKIFGSSANLYCRKSDNTVGTSVFSLGCLGYKSTAQMTVWDPPEIEYPAQESYPLGDFLSLQLVTVTRRDPVTVSCAIMDTWSFPNLATSMNVNASDDRFTSFTVECNRCNRIIVNGTAAREPDYEKIWTFQKKNLPITITAECISPTDSFCLQSGVFGSDGSVSMLHYADSDGIEVYTNGVNLESGVINQIVTRSMQANFSKKWFGSITESNITTKRKLTIVVEATHSGYVYLIPYSDNTRIPFAVTSAYNNPRKFFSQLGITNGRIMRDGAVSSKLESFVHPKLGTFNVSDFEAFNLSYVFGYTPPETATLTIKCSETAPEVEGICVPIALPTSTPSATPLVTDAPESGEARNKFLMIVVGSSAGGLVAICGVVVGIVVWRRKTTAHTSASDIIHHKILPESNFDI